MFSIRLLAYVLLGSTIHAGVLVSRSDKGLQFTDAMSVLVNGKDKAVSLGPTPKITGPVNKLQGVKLTGTLLKDADSNTLFVYEQGSLDYLLPQGLPKTTTGDTGAIWKGAELSYKKSQSDKSPTDISIKEFIAFLPGGAEELTRLCMDERALQLIGGKGKGFATQMEVAAAVVKAHPGDPATAPLQKYIERSMRQRYDQFESGTASVDVLNQGLKFADLSQAVYPADPEQQKLRTALADRRAWLDRRIAVLRAFTASEQWDAFLLGDREFEKYEPAFPDMMARHKDALKQSLLIHRKSGADRLAEGEYGAAVREFRFASLRQPNDSVLQEETRQAWTDYSRRVAIDRQRNRQALGAGQHDAIERDLFFADQNKREKNLDEALKKVLDAENVLRKALPADAIAPESLKVFYKKADILGAQGKISEALASLDEYDLYAVDAEREPANQLRNQLLFQLDKTLKDVKAQVKQAWSEGQFHRVRDLSFEGLMVKNEDADLLYHAGISSLATRDAKRGKAYLARYLEVSNTLEASPEQRMLVRRLLPSTGAPATSSEGNLNWMSGNKLPSGVFYCPISLAFQPKIERIDASGKMKVSFEWEGEKLKAIDPVFEKKDLTGERKISFAYDDRVPQVSSVAYENQARNMAGNDPDEAFKRSSLVVLNNPYIDPVAIEKLTGNNVTLGIAGNRFFNPFIWEKIHYFRFTYDNYGRVATAREIADPKGPAGDFSIEFEWDGMQLTAIRGFQGANHGTPIYERTMQYDGGRLISEEIQGEGKSSHIKYVYKANRLVSANCDHDSSVDGRSRQVFFSGSSPTTVVK